MPLSFHRLNWIPVVCTPTISYTDFYIHAFHNTLPSDSSPLSALWQQHMGLQELSCLCRVAPRSPEVSFTHRQACELRRSHTMIVETARYVFLLSDLFSFLNNRKDLYVLLVLNIFSLESQIHFPSLFIIECCLPFRIYCYRNRTKQKIKTILFSVSPLHLSSIGFISVLKKFLYLCPLGERRN